MTNDYLSIRRNAAAQISRNHSAQSSQGRFRSSNAFGLQMSELRDAAARNTNSRNQDVVQIGLRMPENRHLAASSDTQLPSWNIPESTQTKLAQLREIAKDADYTGMSLGEVAAAIRNRYNEAFGGNLGAFSIAADDELGAINNQYVDEIRLYVEKPLKEQLAEELGFTQSENCAEFEKHFKARLSEIHCEQLGYGGMSDPEIEAAILAKYEGKDQVMDFLNMQAEFRITGVLCRKMGKAYGEYYGTLCRQIQLTYFPDNYIDEIPLQPGEMYNGLLQKFDPNYFFSEMKNRVQQTTYHYYNCSYDVKGQLLENIDLVMSLLQA